MAKEIEGLTVWKPEQLVSSIESNRYGSINRRQGSSSVASAPGLTTSTDRMNSGSFGSINSVKPTPQSSQTIDLRRVDWVASEMESVNPVLQEPAFVGRLLRNADTLFPDVLSEEGTSSPARRPSSASMEEPVLGNGLLGIKDVSVAWLTDLLGVAVDRDLSIRSVMTNGREFNPEEVLRLRALHKGTSLLPEFAWDGPTQTISSQLNHIFEAHQSALFDGTGDSKESRLRIRIHGIGLESTLMSYVATELIDPKIMDSILSLDALCHADLAVTSQVLLKLGLARAFRDEIEIPQREAATAGENASVDLRHTPAQLILGMWLKEISNAKQIADQWAKDVIRRGRADVAGSGVSIRL